MDLHKITKELKRNLLKLLPRYLTYFPLILTAQEDIFKAEDSGDLSHGLRMGELLLPSRLYYIKSLFLNHQSPTGEQLLFYPMTEKCSGPLSTKRKATGKVIKDKLTIVLSQLKLLNETSSQFLRYMSAAQHKISEQNSDVNTLENQAKLEFLALFIHQFNDQIVVDSKLIKCIDDLAPIFFQQFKTFIYPNRKRLESAKKQMENLLNHDPDLFHNTLQIGTTLWRILEKLRTESKNPLFQQMLRRGEWSPASFIAQYLRINIRLFRVTTCKTNLGGVLNYTLPAGKLVTFNPMQSAENSSGLFNRACCGENFITDLLTFLVDYLNPGIRNIPNTKCPYKSEIVRPLY